MSDFHITATTPSIMTGQGKLALARLIVAHIKQALDTGAWVLVGGKAVPCGMLHFYENGAIIEAERAKYETALDQ